MSQRVTSLRPLNQTIESDRTVEGGGFVVRRPFPTARVSHIDPFLLLDEMGRSNTHLRRRSARLNILTVGLRPSRISCTARWNIATPPVPSRRFALVGCNG